MNNQDRQKIRAADVGLPDYFDLQANIGHTKHVGGWPSTQEIAEMCELGPGQELLYVGSGAGIAAIQIAKTYGCQVYGVDLLQSMVDSANTWAEKRGATDLVDFRVGDAQALPFPDNRFDVTLCESVNVFVADLQKAASEYVRVTKSGGYVALNESVWYREPSKKSEQLMYELTGQRLRYPDEWIKMLHDAGLQEIQDRTYPVIMKKEARAQFGFLTLGMYLGMLGRMITRAFSDPVTRKLVKLAFQEPRSIYDDIGYGVYVGKVSA
jgi:ubiquinone/menaquinone biosynthesis C-methylase UbiE